MKKLGKKEKTPSGGRNSEATRKLEEEEINV